MVIKGYAVFTSFAKSVDNKSLEVDPPEAAVLLRPSGGALVDTPGPVLHPKLLAQE